MYDTKSLKEEHRKVNLNGFGQFSECEHCHTKHTEEMQWYGIKYYHRYGKVLCDRCVDKSDYDDCWSNEDAARDGICKFPLPAPVVIDKNLEEQRIYQDELLKKLEEVSND